ncbi:MAG: ABC transporter permease [Fibrobacterota bacterium]
MDRTITMLSTNVRLCILEIVSNKARAFITSLGIFLGVASLLVNLAFVRAMEENLLENMERIGGLNIITAKMIEPITREEKVMFQRSPGLTVGDGQILEREIPEIVGVVKQHDFHWERFSSEGKQTGGILKAVDENFFSVYNYSVGSGRTLTPMDLQQKAQVCVVGPRLVERLYENGGDPLGKKLTVNSLTLTIVGVLSSEGMRSRRDMECLFPYSVYQEKIGGIGRAVEELALLVDGSGDIDQVRTRVANRLVALHRGVRDTEIETNADKIQEMKSAQAGIQILLWSIALISLLVGGISIMNIMFATIGDRIREIGIRKALGAQKLDIFMQFIIEAILVCAVGGIPGMLLGALITLAPQGTFPFVPQLTVADYSLAFGFTVMSGFLSGLFPALKAAEMQPVEALRY